MTVGSPRPEAKAVAYAEGKLEAHAVYTAAERAIDNLRAHQADANKFAAEKRSAQEALADREMTLVTEERATNPDMSQAAFDRHIKGVFQADAEMRRLRGEVMELQYNQDEAMSMVAVNESQIKVLTARMTELGGLLNFYAASKQASGGTR